MKCLLLILVIGLVSGCSSFEQRVVMTAEEYNEFYIQTYIAGWDKAVREVKQCGGYKLKKGVASLELAQ